MSEHRERHSVVAPFQLTVLSSVNAAQVVLLAWVRARAMSVCLMAFFGSMTAGGIAWGVVATRLGAPVTMTIAGCGLLATLAIIHHFRLIDGEKLDLTPSLHWAAPLVVQRPVDERGPVLVTVEYHVDPQHADAFIKAMQRLRLQRMRTGAFQWGLFDDTADPHRFVETFLSESWAEHIRQHARVTVHDREAEDALTPFLIGQEKPIIRHLIHADVKSLRGS